MKDDTCKCCGKRPIAGYIGDGVRLDTLCLKCWKKGGEPAEGHNRRTTHTKEGKS